ncbi:MAG: archaellar assembly protein FlaJ [Anaerolineae bacterium]
MRVVAPFDMFYQLTYMSAMASAGLSRTKTFELAAQAASSAAVYFRAINMLVDEFRFDYPEACRRVGLQAKSDNMRSFLLRLSDALRSGEPLADYLAREAEVQGQDYQNSYERSLESLKQWSNAFSSIVISVALIVIVQVISSMIYSLNPPVISMLVLTGVVISGLSAWIIWRSAPQEIMTVNPAKGSPEQRRALRLFRTLTPVMAALSAVLGLLGVPMGIILIMAACFMMPVGITSLISDGRTNKKDVEFSTFLRSTGGMATASGTTLKEALTKIDLSSFPTLEPDIQRLAKRLQARVDPEICWRRFGVESGSRLISDVTLIFYGAIKVGGDPERVGYLCSLFTAKTAQLRAKRRLTAGTFSGLTTVMQAVVAGLMVFVLSIVVNFSEMIELLMPAEEELVEGRPDISMGLATFSASELSFLTTITLIMVVMLALVSAAAIILSDGGYKLKFMFYLALTVFISGVCMLIVPPMVGGILTM